VDSPGFLLWRTTMRWQRAIAAALLPLDLTHVQFVLLASAWWMSRAEAPNQVQLAAHAGTDIKMTSDVIGRLESKGLLTRSADPGDARAKIIVVTEKGATLAQRAIEVVETADADFFAVVDARPLVSLLQKLGDVR
jgi:DNA-binding MarR family transcriptional regulator